MRQLLCKQGLAGALVVVIVLVSYQQLAPSRFAGTAQQGAPNSAAPSQTPSAGISLAVLPFANLSGDAAQEFFSDGMTEEITAALAKVPGLTVLGRTSAFQFKGQNRDLRDIGQTLGATHLIEGSVRKEGDRMRITAQLVQAGNGANIWSESYDRQLTSVFATQEDIAKAIAAALKVPLGLKQGDTLVRDRTSDLESYDQYLRARALYRARGPGTAQARDMLERVVARDPLFAPAWGLLARAHVSNPDTSVSVRAAREAIRLDSRNAVAYAALARIQTRLGKWVEAEDLYKQALALDPNEPEVLDTYAATLTAAGRIKEGLTLSEKLRTLEPFVPQFNLAVAGAMQLDRRSPASIPLLEAIPVNASGVFTRNAMLAYAYAEAGRFAEAADVLLSMPPQNTVSRRSVEDAARILRSAPTSVQSPDTLPELEGGLVYAYGFVGAADRAITRYEREREIQAQPTTSIWLPVLAPMRKTERFKAHVRAAGLLDYWRERGWPDLCRPVGADDFVCD